MADKIINVRIQQRYDTEANWKAKDPVLLKGEIVYTSDGTNMGKYKVGNGTSKWSALPYAKADLSKGDVTTALGYTPPTSNTWRGIQNNLTSDSTTDSLSAAQGKVLKTLVDGKSANNHNHDSVYSKLGHTHSYLPLSGGTMTGTISSSLVTNTHIAGNKGTAIINSTASGTGYTMLAKMNSKNGVWTFGNYLTEFMLYYTANTTVSAGTNAPTYGVRLLDESGNSKFPGTVTANSFSGPLSGNASTSTVATKLGRGGDTSTPMVFNWSGKDGQPTWLWGGSDGTNMYVYNPSNFSVKYATSAGSATNATYLNIVATNEIRFNKPSRTKKESLWFGYAWSDGSKSDLISTYCFGNGNGGYAQITASQFNGPLNGNASTASSAAKWATARTLTLTGSVTGSVSIDGSGNVSFATTTNHTHNQYYDSGISRAANTVLAAPNGNNGSASFRKLVAADIPSLSYLPLSGGTMTGNIGIPSGKSNIDGSVPYAGSENNTLAISGFSNYKTYLGSFVNSANNAWYNAISVRHRNGNGDGSSYGMILYSTLTTSGSLLWNKQTGASSWQGERTIIDSANYNSYAPTKTGGGASGTWSISVSGNAATATKLATARSITLGGLSSGSASFDGSGNITIDNWGYGCKKYVTQSSTSAPYFRIAYCEDKYNYSDRSMIFVIDSGYNGGGFGIVKVAFRNNDISKEGQSNCELKWLVRQGFSANQLFVKGNAPAGESQYADLYFKATTTYQAISITVLSMGNRGSKIRVWTFEEGNTRANPDIRKYTYTVEGSDAGTANYANSAGAVAWGNISGKPSTFTPASHTHSYAGAASSGGSATSAVKLDTGTAGSSTQPVYFTGGKPVACTYTLGKSVPSNAVFTDTNTWRPLGTTANTACAGNDSRLSNARPASDVYSWAKASTKPSYSWSEITGKPGTFTPSSHTHNYLTLYGGRPANINFSTSTNGTGAMFHFVATSSTTTGKSPKDANILQMNWDNNGGWDTQLAISPSDTPSAYIRSQNNGTWGKWLTLLDSSNYTSYTVTKTGSGASGTWGISITGSSASCTGKAATAGVADSANAVAWANVSGKPSSYTPSSHTHNYAGSSSAGGAANSSYKLSNVGQITTVDALNNFNEASIFKYATMAALDGLDGLSKNDGIILSAPWSSANYGHQIFLDDNGYTIAHRYRNNGTWSSWKKLIDSSNIGSQSVNYATSAGSVPWSGVSGKPSSLPASDVYSWAKASTKPSYSWNEIGSKPSTFTPSNHTHSYLPLSGGTMTGQIKRDSCGGSWISARTNAPLVGSGSTSGGWNPIVAQKTKNGSWSIGNLNGNEHLSFSYTTDADYNNGKNVATTINLPPTSGTLCLTNHTHPYLPTTGGTLNNGSTQCPLIITGAANNESSITFKYKTQTSGGHWVVGQGAGTANIDTFAFYKNGAGTLATLMADGQFRFSKLTLSGYQPKEYSAVGGVGAIANDYTIRFRGGTDGYFITKGPSSLNFGWDTDTSVVGDGSGSWGYTFRMQMKYCYCDVGFRSSGIYHTTISGSSNLNISSDGTIKRVSSAAKYKLDIQNINKPDTYAYNLLNLNPKQWFDKGETERYAKYLTAQYSGEKLRDEEESELLDGSINPYYGLIAEDVKAAGLDEFCIYGKADKNGKKELEGIQYDRIPILTIPILRDLVTCMQKILPSVEKNISDSTLLSEVKEIESRFNSFNPQNIVNKQYVN